ncbi:aluminum resistance protein, partial [Clostridium botulinum CFSAN001627]
MLHITKDTLKNIYDINPKALDLYEKAIEDIKDEFQKYDDIREFNQ